MKARHAALALAAVWVPLVLAMSPGRPAPAEPRTLVPGADDSVGALKLTMNDILNREHRYLVRDDFDLLEQVDACGTTVPLNFDPQSDCVELGFRSNGNLKWTTPGGQDEAKPGSSIIDFLQTYQCFLLPIREPAERVEEWYKYNFGAHPHRRLLELNITQTVDNVLAIELDPEHKFHGLIQRDITHDVPPFSPPSPPPPDAPPLSPGVDPTWAVLGGLNWAGSRRTTPMSFYLTNTSRESSSLFTWGLFKRELQRAPGAYAVEVRIPYGIGATEDSLIDCAQNKTLIRFVCTNGAEPGGYDVFKSELSSGEGGSVTEVPPMPVGEHADWNPPLAPVPSTTYPDASFKLSDINRRLVNEVLYREDMAILRHVCGGEAEAASGETARAGRAAD